MNFKVWTLVLLLAPLVYVLTLPPVFILLQPRPQYVATSGPYGMPHFAPRPRWTDWYCKPYIWLCNSSAIRDRVGGPLQAYYRWWAKRLPQVGERQSAK